MQLQLSKLGAGQLCQLLLRITANEVHAGNVVAVPVQPQLQTDGKLIQSPNSDAVCCCYSSFCPAPAYQGAAAAVLEVQPSEKAV